MKTLLFHVGYGKTGTSAIQAALTRNVKRLADHGVFYATRNLAGPRMGPHALGSTEEFKRSFRNKIPEEPFVDRAEKIFREILERDDVETAIWSHEALLGRQRTLGEVARRLAPVARTRVVIYFRNHIDLIVSGYLQWAVKHKVKRGRIPDLETYLNRSSRKLSYENVIAIWGEAVGPENLILRSYDAAGGDVVPDFMQACGLDVELDRPERKRTNSTPDTAILSLYKVYNDQFDEPKGPRALMSLLKRSGVTARDIHPVDPWPMAMTPEFAASLSTRFADQISWLDREHGVKLNAHHKPIRERPDTPPVAYQTDLVAILTMMALYLDQRVELLQAELKALRAGKASVLPIAEADEDDDGDLDPLEGEDD